MGCSMHATEQALVRASVSEGRAREPSIDRMHNNVV